MKTKSRRFLAAAVVMAGLGTTAFGVNQALAATESATHKTPISPIVNALAERFNLDPNDVQAVFEEQRQEMEKERAAGKFGGPHGHLGPKHGAAGEHIRGAWTKYKMHDKHTQP